MRRLLTLLAPVEAPDGEGGETRIYVAGPRFFARVVARSGALVGRADQTTQDIIHDVYFRARADVTSDTRLALGDRVFHVIAVRDCDEAGVFSHAVCEELKP